MANRIIVVGANHAGTSFLRTLRQLDKTSEVVTYDRNDNISFLGCGIALWVGGEFSKPDGLFYATPEQLKGMNIDVKMKHDVIAIDTKTKTIKVKNLENNKEFDDKYDKLIFAGGSWPIIPPFPGVNLKGIYLSKIFQHAQKIHDEALNEQVKNVVVIGAGYIGVELAEAFHKKGKKVTLIDMEERVIPRYFDKELTEQMEKRIKKAGVQLELGQKVEKFEGNDDKHVTHVVTNKGKYKADLVILSIGFIPQTKMLKGQVEMLPNGAIIVDEYARTAARDVYAIGDSSAIKQNVTHSNMHIALATNAVKTGIIAAFDAVGKGIPFPGAQGTNAICVFDCNYASTGFSEETCKALNIKAKSAYVEENDRPEFMKSYGKVHLKITYDPDTLKVLGAQIGSFGEINHTETITAFSLAISKGLTMVDIALMDYFFLPHFNKPFNYMIVAALKAVGLKF